MLDDLEAGILIPESSREKTGAPCGISAICWNAALRDATVLRWIGQTLWRNSDEAQQVGNKFLLGLGIYNGAAASALVPKESGEVSMADPFS